MAPARKVTAFHREGNDWYSNAGLPSDITVILQGISFHLHKFPLVSKCGKIARICEESREKVVATELEDGPGSPDIFLLAVKFCYSTRVEFNPGNILTVYCMADYLEMTEDYGEGNLVSKAATFLQKNVISNWKDCILALQSAEAVITRAEKLQIISKCLNALCVMVHMDPTLFGWPKVVYGRLQSPGGSILWNGINTGAKISYADSDWWFEGISCLNVGLFERLIKTIQTRGVQRENLSAAIIYYAKKHLPGLDRWSGPQGGKITTVTGFSSTLSAIDRRVILETIEKILPLEKERDFCRFLLGLLRLALILGSSQTCLDALQKRIGMQLEMATLDSLLIPSYSDSDTLYNIDCIERIVHYFLLDIKTSSSSTEPLRKVAKLIDDYLAEVASDVNLKPSKILTLADALPESSRQLHDGLYRALDIYFKAHPWLLENEKEELCNVIDCQRLSIDACAHASQNDRLPLRIVLRVLFFEQMQLRTALAGCLGALEAETAQAATPLTDMGGQIVKRDGWVTVERQNQVLKVDMEKMRARVGELEAEFAKIKQKMKGVSKSHSPLDSPRLATRETGFKLLPKSSRTEQDAVAGSTELTSRVLVEKACKSSQRSTHRRSFS